MAPFSAARPTPRLPREIAPVGSRRVAHAEQARQRLASLARQAARPILLLPPAPASRPPVPPETSPAQQCRGVLVHADFSRSAPSSAPSAPLLPAASPASRPMVPSSYLIDGSPSLRLPRCACAARPISNLGELSGLGVLSTRRLEAPARLVVSARRAHACDSPALVHDERSQRKRRLQGDGAAVGCAHHRHEGGGVPWRFGTFRSPGGAGGPETC